MISIICSSYTPFYPKHNIYISVIDIKKIKNQKSTSIQIKVFKDDLQVALQNFFPAQKEQFLLSENFCKTHATPITAYFKRHFKLKINGKSKSILLKKVEAIGDSFWLHFQIQQIQV